MPYAEVNETTLFYHEQGSGPLAVFIHGFPLDGTMWLDQMEELAPHRRCVAPDLRGSGRSDATNLGVLTMEQHADDLAALIAGLGETRADVIGLSMGGYVALAMWERYPELFRSLALVDTKSGADDEAGKAKRELTAIQVVTGGRKEFSDNMLEVLVASHAGPFVKARIRSMIEDSRYETIVAALMGMAARPDRTDLLPGVSVPTAVIVGADDKLTPVAQSEAMVAAIPEASLHVISDAGHMAPVEQPEAVNAAIAELFNRSSG